MSKAFTYWLVFVLLTVSPLAQAQSVWPGDVNSNGVVNCVDVIYWGYAYGESGPPRTTNSVSWQAHPMPANWGDRFTGGIDYAYADANGDGAINMADANNGIEGNFFKTRGTPEPDITSDMDGGFVSLRLNANTDSAEPGDFVEMDISMGGETEVVHGLAFILEYDPDQVVPNSFEFIKNGGFGSNQTYTLGMNNHAEGVVEVAFTRISNFNFFGVGTGRIGKIRFQLSDTANAEDFSFGLQSATCINQYFTVLDLSIRNQSIIVVNNSGGNNDGGGSCPDVVNPVCGSDGKVYLNSCYAERAGVTNYTPGVCNPDCVDPTQINPNVNCPAVYDPVCGCNGVTYSNACEAEAAGVQSWTPGPCNSDINECYDPTLIVTSDATTVNSSTGVITFNCTEQYDPVCGCNGVTYDNACIAEANGVRFYTQGACNTSCVDPAQMDPDAVCTLEYDPVCGCNGVTYSNACAADAAGVVSYTPGVCGAESNWCDKAITLSCGDFLSNESTANAGNDIDAYPCSNKNYNGPERVYVINKTSAGDLQIGLEILTANRDLDIFLLSSDCSQINCLRSSKTNNTQTNNEGILYEDAPIGTYYLVVDGSQSATYHLEISCGYLDCSEAIQLSCGQTYNGNNSNGSDNVSLYGCSGNLLNVENNGPETVHYFTVTEAGDVTVSLTNLSANLELFLLSDCDRGACLDFSQNNGTNNESISAYLEPGVYYVVVDGKNGATSNYKLRVDCTSSCNINMNLTPETASCGQNDGSIFISITGGSPSYYVTWSGPVSGSASSSNSSGRLRNLPAGTYTVKVTDMNNCSITKQVTINSGGNLVLSTEETNATCGQTGSVRVTVQNGTPKYTIYVTGEESGTFESNSSVFTLRDLAPGTYHLYIVDENGCSASTDVTITQSEGSFYFTSNSNPVVCESLGSINIRTYGGSAPYKIKVTGPKSGSATSSSSRFNIVNLPAGTYKITIEDSNWCTYTETVVVTSNELEVTMTEESANCAESGSIQLHMSNGSPTYMIEWDGPVSGSTATNNSTYTIQNLPAGSYQVTVKDDNWCVVNKIIHISGGSGFDVVFVPEGGACETPGKIGVDIIGGQAPYKITWSGPESGSTNTHATWVDIENLPGGTYTITVMDDNWCTYTKNVVVNSNELEVTMTEESSNCAPTGSIQLLMTNGAPTYIIEWDGPVDGSTATNNSLYTIPNLPAGTYEVMVKDENWCVVTKIIHVSGGSDYEVELVPKGGVCETPGEIGVDIFGGQAPYKITWSGPESGSTNYNGTWFDIENLPSGVYTVTVKDANGCIVSSSTEVIESENDLFVDAEQESPDCGATNSIALEITGGSPSYLIEWTGPENGSITTNNPDFVIENLIPGNYYITIKDANWCVAHEYITVNETTTEIFTASVTDALCETPGSIKLTFTGGTPSYNIKVTGPRNINTTTSSNMFTINDLPEGSYTIQVTDANGCTQTRVVKVEGASDISINASLIADECGGFTTIWIDVIGGSPTYTIEWTGPTNGSTATNSSAFEIFDALPGKYTITVKDENWCVASTMIMVFESPGDLFTTEVTDAICETPGSIKLNFTGGDPVYNISWDGPAPGSASTSASMFTIPNLPVGTYTVTVTDSNGCTDVETVEVELDEGGISINTSLIVNDCGQYNSIWIDIFGGMPTYTIEWEGPVSGSTTTDATGYDIMDLPPGKYTITVKDKNWCFVTDMIMVFETPVEIFEATPNNGDCDQNGSIALTMTGTPDYEISWSGPESGSQTTSADSYTIEDLPAGDYEITVTDDNGCVEIETATLTGGGNLAATITGENGTSTEMGKIIVDITDGTAPFSISFSGGGTSGTLNANNTGMVEISNLPSGEYDVTVTDDSGCSISETVIITITEDLVDITVSQTGNTCQPTGSVIVNITGGTAPYNLSWSGGDISGSATTSSSSVTIQNLPAGTYTITVLSQNGSSDMETIEVFAGGDLDFSASTTNGSCGGNGQVLINVNGGTAPFAISWSGPTNGSDNTSDANYTIPNLPPGNYTVTVMEDGGCSASKMVTVSSENEQPTADFTHTINGSTVVFNNQSSPGTYNWTFGDGNTADATNPTNTYGDAGNYQVCLTVTNNCGSDQTCKNITVGSPTEDAAIIDVKEISGAAGTTVFVPVIIENCVTSTLVSFAGSLSIGNTSVGQITGITPGSIAPQYNAANQTFSYFNNTGGGVPCGEGQILFYINVELVGDPGAFTEVTITDAPLVIELGGIANGNPVAIPYGILPGEVSISNTARVAGDITTYWGDPLPEVEVSIASNDYNDMKMTDENGHYELPELKMGAMYTIAPRRNYMPENGLSTYALFAGQRFILGMQPQEIVSPYQIIAGDANCDGRFTTLDLFLIQRIIIGSSQNFGDCPSWVFVKKEANMPEEFNSSNVFPFEDYDEVMLMQDTVSDFVGVKVGDILGHANPTAVRSNGKLEFIAPNRHVQAGELIEIPVRSSDFNDIATYQLGLAFQIGDLEFVEVVRSDNPALNSLAIGDSDAANGVLRMSWFDLQGEGLSVDADETLFTLRFRALTDIEDLTQVLVSNSRFIRSEAFTDEGEKLDVEFRLANGAPTEQAISYKLYQNTPNPFRQATIIGFDLPQDMEVDLIIFDQFGKVVRTFNGDFAKGYNQVDIPRESLAAGVYYYSLRTGDFADTKSMIILE